MYETILSSHPLWNKEAGIVPKSLMKEFLSSPGKSVQDIEPFLMGKGYDAKHLALAKSKMAKHLVGQRTAREVAAGNISAAQGSMRSKAILNRNTIPSHALDIDRANPVPQFKTSTGASAKSVMKQMDRMKSRGMSDTNAAQRRFQLESKLDMHRAANRRNEVAKGI